MNGEFLHARFVAQDTALTAFAAGVDGQHSQLAAVFLQYMQSEYIDRRTFAGSRHTADAYTRTELPEYGRHFSITSCAMA